MTSETIVAVFDTAVHAETAISALIASGVPAHAIEHYAQGAESTGYADTTTATTEKKHGVWAWLTGEQTTDSDHHHALYDQSVRSGGTVVTVVTDSVDADKVYTILASHDPVDLDERHAHYASTGAYGDTLAPATTGTDEVLTLSEETLQVGKRVVDHGTTRVRRYVVERPVEEQMRLRNETVSVFRRPVTAGAAIAPDAFTDRTISVNETDEEIVVAKSAHVVEEVVVQKGVEERTETVRDTLRREEVEITGPDTTRPRI